MNPAPPDLSRRQSLALLGAAGLATLPGCGTGTEKNQARVRLVNASTGWAELDLRIDDQLKHSAVRYGQRASYAEADPDKPETTIFAPNSPTALLRWSPALAEDRWVTVLAYGPAGALRQLTLDDNRGEAADNRAVIRVVNAASDAGALDLYLTAESEELTSAVALLAGAAYGTANDWQTVNSGSWRLRATAQGNKADVRLDLSGITLGSRSVWTLVLSASAGGTLVDALWLAQRGDIGVRANTQARVRLAALLTDSTSVTAELSGTRLGGTVGSPAVGDYVRLPAGSLALALSLNGVAQPASSVLLEAGRDYTLVIAGTPGAARRVLIADDNRLPSDSARAKLRLVNALADGSTAAALTLDFLPVAGEVVADAASDTALVDATTTGRLAVTARGAAAPLFVAVDQVLRANTPHTVFVAGTVAAATGILRRDR